MTLKIIQTTENTKKGQLSTPLLWECHPLFPKILRRKKMHKGRLQPTKMFSSFHLLRSYSFDLILILKNVGQYPTAVSTGRSKWIRWYLWCCNWSLSPLNTNTLSVHVQNRRLGLFCGYHPICFDIRISTNSNGLLDATYSYYAHKVVWNILISSIELWF